MVEVGSKFAKLTRRLLVGAVYVVGALMRTVADDRAFGKRKLLHIFIVYENTAVSGWIPDSAV